MAARTRTARRLQKYLTTWPVWLFARGDVAAGGAGDESPLIINDKSLKAEPLHHFTFNRGGRVAAARRTVAGAARRPREGLPEVAAVNPRRDREAVVIWRNATIGYRAGGRGPRPGKLPAARGGRSERRRQAVNRALSGDRPAKSSLRSVVSEETAKRLDFGKSGRRDDRPRRFRIGALHLVRSACPAGHGRLRVPSSTRRWARTATRSSAS